METPQGSCRNCEPLRRELARLRVQLERALARIAELEGEVPRLKKNSSTSSKPPSSDIVKPPKPPTHGRRKGKRRCGGQKGHLRHTRPAFPPEQVDHTRIYEWPEASRESEWEPLEEFRRLQQVELLEKLFEVTEYCARLYRHRRTGEVVAAPLPEDVRCAGLVGPRLSAWIAYQKGACHMPYRVIETFLAEVMHLPLSTGHPDSGQRLWTWGFHAPRPQGFTLFHIDPSRSSEVLKEFLGETFRGVVGCDYLSAYRKFLHDMGAAMQFCWAHLIRDVKYLVTLPDAVTRRFGEKLLGKIKHLFRTWHRRDQTPAERWSRAAEKAKRAVLKVARRPPARSEAQNINERFRFVVIDRRITQGTRGETGRRWCERIWTVLATCAQQGRSAFVLVQRELEDRLCGLAG